MEKISQKKEDQSSFWRGFNLFGSRQNLDIWREFNLAIEDFN